MCSAFKIVFLPSYCFTLSQAQQLKFFPRTCITGIKVMKQKILFFLWLLPVVFTEAQLKKQAVNRWRVALERKDGKQVVFQLERTQEEDKTVLYIINAAERIKITDVKTAGDSM